MTNGDKSFLHAAVDAKLIEVLDALPAAPGWYEPWRRLGPDSTGGERLAAYQAIRDSATLPEDAGFYLVAWQVDEIASDLAGIELRRLEDRLEAIEAAHGLQEGSVWEPGEAPPAYAELLEQYHAAWDGVFAGQLDLHGEHEIAELFRTDPEEFERRNVAGRRFFHGPPRSVEAGDPTWLDSLLEAVGECLSPESLMGPLGALYREEDGFWDVDIYPAIVELVGGADDGALVSPAFSLDLEGLRSTFARVDDFGWNALGSPDGGGPYIWIEGDYEGHALYFRLLAQAPEGEEAGAKLRVPK